VRQQLFFDENKTKAANMHFIWFYF